uniref:Plant heme peroxidase family profile domain-containing protein n=1 Tax=Rhizochromulina marina TaxID=1034831 RepID=A0A7S2SH24_9STRA|mmetsp:Transcript_3011/g.8657  ORF Transcript_3011/g.8657 Transcript_3011/m.8657 type:complete len:326 (+) Transcript_3011:59-1036(+)
MDQITSANPLAMVATAVAIVLAVAVLFFASKPSAKVAELRKARKLCEELIRSKSCAPILVRLAWHDSGTYDNNRSHLDWPNAGGAIGSIRTQHEINAGPNAGLSKALTKYLGPIKGEVPGVSWADLIQLASATAIEVSGGPKIPMRYGRVDGEPTDKTNPPFGLPDALPPFGGDLADDKDPAEHLRYVFEKYDMSDRDIVALSGAHTLGRAFKDRSGTVKEGYSKGTAYTSRGCPFVLNSETLGGRSWTKYWLSFDNSYFEDMAQEDPDCVTFPTDKVLMTDAGFQPHFMEFAESQSAFFTQYKESHKKLSELGAKFDPPEGVRI